MKVEVYSDVRGWSWVAVDANDQAVGDAHGLFEHGKDAAADARAAHPSLALEYLDPPT